MFIAPAALPLLIITVIVHTGAVFRRNKPDKPVKPTCDSPIYCYGDLLRTVQLARLYRDSKTFVDLQMRFDINKTLENFNQMMNATLSNPCKYVVKQFVEENFIHSNELIRNVTLNDFTENPSFLKKIKDPVLQAFGLDLHKIWAELAVKVNESVKDFPERYSLEPVPNPFVIPGGRFTEPYYWDSYWIICGLLICDMPETTRGMIENLFWFIDKYGFIPNGGRIYYSRRSQPPLLTAMVAKYYEYTEDTTWLRKHIHKLDQELNFWLKFRSVKVRNYTLLRYHSATLGPRPESYREDYLTAKDYEPIYVELKSGAETGWDYSSRWFLSEKKKTRLKDLRVGPIIPVDLNAFYCNAAGTLAHLYQVLGFNAAKAHEWKQVQNKFKEAIFTLLWNEKDGVWYDYDILDDEQRKFYFASNLTPLWGKCLHDDQQPELIGTRAAEYLLRTGVTGFPGGIPMSLINSGEQWDWPNAWAPYQNIIAEGLEESGSELARNVSFEICENWVKSCLFGFQNSHKMYEKYDVRTMGKTGEGGEYKPQWGFGWTNGVVLQMLEKYGDKLMVLGFS